MASMTTQVTTTGIFICAGCARSKGLKVRRPYDHRRVITRACQLCLLDREPVGSTVKPRTLRSGDNHPAWLGDQRKRVNRQANNVAILMRVRRFHRVGVA
jgi:hypothetical protein